MPPKTPNRREQHPTLPGKKTGRGKAAAGSTVAERARKSTAPTLSRMHIVERPSQSKRRDPRREE